MTEIKLGAISIHTTSGRGQSAEEITDRVIKRMVSISDQAPDHVRQQMRAYEHRMKELLLYAVRQGMDSERTTIYNTLRNHGLETAAEAVRRKAL